jgi:hypothetical protein
MQKSSTKMYIHQWKSGKTSEAKYLDFLHITTFMISHSLHTKPKSEMKNESEMINYCYSLLTRISGKSEQEKLFLFVLFAFDTHSTKYEEENENWVWRRKFLILNWEFSRELMFCGCFLRVCREQQAKVKSLTKTQFSSVKKREGF